VECKDGSSTDVKNHSHRDRSKQLYFNYVMILWLQFLSSDAVATCAADGMVRVRSVASGASLLECSCHCGRVKRLAAAPDNNNLIWSAGEDGLIL
jgi:WD40 repeat protein